MRRYVRMTVLLLLFAAVAIVAKAQKPPKYEVRAVWLTTIGGIDWPHSYYPEQQKRELTQMLDRLQHAGINTVLLQTRIRATTIYPSYYEPFDGCVTGHPGRTPAYDPLQFAVDECHRRGMELHAWVVAIPVGKWNEAGCQRLRRSVPRLLKRIGAEGFLNPEAEGTGEYLAKLCDEIVGRYDVDGIHLDYMRYPDQWGRIASKHTARQNITRIVRTISRTVKARKPWVKMSCSPVGKYADLTRYSSKGWNAYSAVCQDAQGWMREGLMDQLYPMMYFRGNQFFPFAIDWQEHSYGRTVAPGVAAYMLDPKEGNWKLPDITRELRFLREQGMGHTFFRAKFLLENWKGIYDFVADELDIVPALVPPMTWMGTQRPAAPTRLSVRRTQQGVELSWTGSPSMRYNIYASDDEDVDTSDPRNLVAAGWQGQRIVVASPRFSNSHFAVCATDRYGLESQPLTSVSSKYNFATPQSLLACDGQWLQVPRRTSVDPSTLLVVETLQGSIIATRRWQSDRLYVGNLPEGFYRLRSLGRVKRKHVAHSLGHFMIRRRI